MSKIEKALEKFQKESEGKAGQAPTPSPGKHSNADHSQQNTSDKKTTKRDSRIMSAIEKSGDEKSAESSMLISEDHDQ